MAVISTGQALGITTPKFCRLVLIFLFAIPCYFAVFFICRRSYGNVFACAALLTMLFSGIYLLDAYKVRLDVPWSGLALLTLWSFSKVVEEGTRKVTYMLVASVALGAALWTKYQAVTLVIAIVLYLVLLQIADRRRDFKRSLGPSLVLLAVSAASILSIILYFESMDGMFSDAGSPSGAALALFQGLGFRQPGKVLQLPRVGLACNGEKPQAYDPGGDQYDRGACVGGGRDRCPLHEVGAAACHPLGLVLRHNRGVQYRRVPPPRGRVLVLLPMVPALAVLVGYAISVARASQARPGLPAVVALLLLLQAIQKNPPLLPGRGVGPAGGRVHPRRCTGQCHPCAGRQRGLLRGCLCRHHSFYGGSRPLRYAGGPKRAPNLLCGARLPDLSGVRPAPRALAGFDAGVEVGIRVEI